MRFSANVRDDDYSELDSDGYSDEDYTPRVGLRKRALANGPSRGTLGEGGAALCEGGAARCVGDGPGSGPANPSEGGVTEFVDNDAGKGASDPQGGGATKCVGVSDKPSGSDIKGLGARVGRVKRMATYVTPPPRGTSKGQILPPLHSICPAPHAPQGPAAQPEAHLAPTVQPPPRLVPRAPTRFSRKWCLVFVDRPFGGAPMRSALGEMLINGRIKFAAWRDALPGAEGYDRYPRAYVCLTKVCWESRMRQEFGRANNYRPILGLLEDDDAASADLTCMESIGAIPRRGPRRSRGGGGGVSSVQGSGAASPTTAGDSEPQPEASTSAAPVEPSPTTAGDSEPQPEAPVAGGAPRMAIISPTPVRARPPSGARGRCA
jgi:hypothetical protein